MDRALAHSVAWRRSNFSAPITKRLGRPAGRLDLLVAVPVAILTGALLTRYALPTAILIFGTLVVIAMARIPWLPYVLASASVATVAFYAGWPEVFGVKIPELILVAALLTSVGHLVRSHWRGPSIETSLMIVFLTAIAGGVYLGVEHGASVDEAVKGVRAMVFYTAFWPALVVAADSRLRLLVMRLAAVAVPVLVGLQLAQVQVGLERPLFAFTSAVQNVALTPQADGFLRVRPPGLTLIYVATIFAAAYLLWGPRPHRLRASIVCATGLVGVFLSLNRNMIIGIALGLMVAAILVPKRNRVAVAGLVCTFMAVASFSLWQAERGGGATGSVVQRIASIGNVSELRSGTLRDRSYENRAAISVLKSEPLTGIGWGTPYGASLTEYRNGRLVIESRGFMHQQYLWIWMRAGLAGLVALLILLALTLTSAAQWSRKRAWDDQSWLGPAVVASGTALAASATVGTYLSNPDSIVVLVGVLALGYALRRERVLHERKALA